MNRFIITILFALWIPFTQAADLDKGTKAFENGNYNNARYELEPLAEAGDAQAQVLVGLMYALGSGYRKDLVQAHKWMTLSARSGNADAIDARERIAPRMTRSQLREAQSLANRFRPTPLAQNSTASSWSQPPQSLPTGRALVAEIQAGLSRLGYAPGTADGLMGKRTVTAISDFQRQTGRPIDGRTSQELLLAIRKAESDGMRASTPPSARPTPLPLSSNWYFVQQDLDGVMRSLRSLLESNDKALRSGVTNLVQRSQWPWNTQVFRDDFKKSAQQGGLDWQVIRGEYAIRDGLLSDARSRVQPPAAPTPAAPSRKLSDKDKVLGILGALLGSRVEQNDSQQQAEAPQQQRSETDEVRLAAATSARFLLRTRVLAQDPSGGTAFVLQRTARGEAEELRLRYDANAQQLIIEHATGTGVRQIASSALRLEAGQHYNFEWARVRGGLMQVALNGRLLMSAARSEFRGSFDDFVWRNNGGSYLMTEIEMHTQRRR